MSQQSTQPVPEQNQLPEADVDNKQPQQQENQEVPSQSTQQNMQPQPQQQPFGYYPYPYNPQFPMQQQFYQQQYFMNPYQYGFMPPMQQQQFMQQQQVMQNQFMPQQQNQMNQLTNQMKGMQVTKKKVVTLEIHKEKTFNEQELIQQINSKEYKWNKDAYFFMLKSYNEENIVKAITNNIWSSTKDMNKKLNQLFEKVQSTKTPIYLFFSINSKGAIEGCAKMVSKVNFDGVFEGWSQQGKWFGIFDIDWVFIKEVPNREFKHLTNKLNENKPVYICKNGQEIPIEQGNQMMKIFASFQHSVSLIDKVKDYQK